MKIREGAYYRTRNGGVVGPLKLTDRSQRYTWAFLTDLWTPEGEYAIGEENPFDLISEVYVSDTPPCEGVNLPATDGPDSSFWETKTLRDEFAMVALSDFMSQFRENVVSQYAACRLSYDWADAMMEARKK